MGGKNWERETEKKTEKTEKEKYCMTSLMCVIQKEMI